jgi:phosphotransferase system HPr (HPr) family protein
VRIERELTVTNEEGLHFRPAAFVVKVANAFKSRITLSHGKTTADAGSLMGIVCLCAGEGSQIKVSVEGEDAHDAIGALEALFVSRFEIPLELSEYGPVTCDRASGLAD